MVWDAGALEKSGLHPCSMGHSAERGRNSKADDDGIQDEVPGSNATSAIVAGT
jgi:hypothetical protein